MKYLAAYLLVALSGAEPSKEAVSATLAASGGEVDDSKLEKLFAEVGGKDLDELIATGKAKIGSVPSGAGAAPSGGAAPAAAAAKPAEKEKEPEPEDDADVRWFCFTAKFRILM